MSRYIRKGCNFDIQKCFVDGKPLIIEGCHLDPDLYLDRIKDVDGEEKLKIITPEPLDETESSLET